MSQMIYISNVNPADKDTYDRFPIVLNLADGRKIKLEPGKGIEISLPNSVKIDVLKPVE